MKSIQAILAGMALYTLSGGPVSAVSACDSVQDDDDAQTINDNQTVECTVSPALGIFSVAQNASVDVTQLGAGETAVYVPNNNLDVFLNSGSIAGTFTGVSVSSNGTGAENETHIDDFTNTGFITVSGGAGIAAVYNISGFIDSLNNSGTLSNDSLSASPALNSDLTGNDNYTTGLYNLASIGTLTNSGSISGATAITNLTSSGIENRIGTINNTGTLTGTIANGILNEGNIGVINNSKEGTIKGAEAGLVNAGTINQINNAGTLGGGTWALYNGGTVSGGIHNSGILNGAVYLGDATLYISGNSAAVNGPVTGTAGSVFSVGDGSTVAQYALQADNPVTTGSLIIGQGSLLTLENNAHVSTTGKGSVSNAGTIVMDNNSGISGNVINTGTLSLADASRLSASVTGNLSNSGGILLNPTATSAGNTLTVNGDYTGLPGSTLSLGSVLADDNSLTDRLIVTGNTSGSSTLFVENENGAGAATLDGIQLISIGGDSGATFRLGNRVVAGAYDYSLRKGNASGTDTSGWYLTSLYNTPEPAPEPVPVPVPTPAPPSTPGKIPAPVRAYRPETAAYAANLQAANTLFSLSLRNRRGESRFIDPVTGTEGTTSLWMRNTGGGGRVTMDDGQNHTRSSRYVLMIGGDLAEGSTDGIDAFHVGLMGGYARAENKTHNGLTGFDARGSLHGYTTGLYGTWLQDAERKTGFWADSWAQYSWFSNEVHGDTLSAEQYDSRGLQAALEAGYAWEIADWQSGYGMSNRVFLEPHVQAILSGIRAEDHTESNGTRIQATGNDNVSTRLGGRIYLNGKSHYDRRTFREFQPFAEVNWLHSTQQYGVRMNAETDGQRGMRNAAEFKTGVEGRLSENLSGYVAFTQQTGSRGYRDSEGSVLLSYKF